MKRGSNFDIYRSKLFRRAQEYDGVINLNIESINQRYEMRDFLPS